MTNEQRKRVHEITYSTQDREELAERIVRLEDERDLYSSLVEVMDHPDTANQLRAENAKLRGLLTEGNEELTKMRRAIDYLYSFAKTCGVDAEDMRELGIEVGE